MELHKAIKDIVSHNGAEKITNAQIINYLLDYGAFSDVPASKTIVQAMVAGGYCQKILDLEKQKSSIREDNGILQIKLKGYIDSISKQNGFHLQLVDYVVKCVIFGLGWIDDVPVIPNSQSTTTIRSKIQTPPPLSAKSGVTSGINTNTPHSITYQNIVDSQFLVMKVSPINASVFVDGLQQFVSNGIMATELSIGQHFYEVKAENYEEKNGYVEIKSDNKTEIAVTLSLEKKYVKLSIEADDIDADIIINGETYGKGKWEGLVEEGKYEIEATKYRFYPYKKSISLYGIDKEKISIPSLKGICGNLKVNIQPYGSSIHINKEYKGDTPLLVKDILIGERKLYVQTKELTSYETVVEIKENKTTEVNHIIPSLFLYDYSEVKIGDYFYEDGSFSHKRAFGKEAVGIVFNLNPSEEEKKKGWSHGQIIALNNVRFASINRKISWGIATKEIRKNIVVNPKENGESPDNGYMITHLDSVLNNPEFEAFNLAAEYEANLPTGITSGWYLPCIAQWRILHKAFFMDNAWHPSELMDLRKSCGHKTVMFATSSLFNTKEAWKFAPSYSGEGYYSKVNISNYASRSALDEDRIRAVASF